MNSPDLTPLPDSAAVSIDRPDRPDKEADSGVSPTDGGLPRRKIPDPNGSRAGMGGLACGDTPRCAELGGIRGEMFRHLREGAIHSFRDQLPQYAGTLERLLRAAAGNPVEQLRLESDHRMFFEQVKAVLVTERIQLRLELERVKASRRYGREGARSVRTCWEG
jgi:hypothetical protein